MLKHGRDKGNPKSDSRYIILISMYIFKDVRYSKAQKMLKFAFNALIQQLWLRALHTAEKHHPTMFRKATVRPKRSSPYILYNTSLSFKKAVQGLGLK